MTLQHLWKRLWCRHNFTNGVYQVEKLGSKTEPFLMRRVETVPSKICSKCGKVKV